MNYVLAVCRDGEEVDSRRYDPEREFGEAVGQALYQKSLSPSHDITLRVIQEAA